MTKSKKPDFRPNEFVVYPAHGVGKIVSIEEQEIAGIHLELFVISFEKDKMTLRVPTHKATDVGMRSLSTPDVVTKALDTLKGKARVKRAMWSRRAQEYEQKINSGDLMAIAEVVRDLHRSDDQREQSYSERQLYEAALERLTREVAAVSGVDEAGAQKKVGDVLVGRVFHTFALSSASTGALCKIASATAVASAVGRVGSGSSSPSSSAAMALTSCNSSINAFSRSRSSCLARST
jgi:CarD family transcriptional regulator